MSASTVKLRAQLQSMLDTEAEQRVRSEGLSPALLKSIVIASFVTLAITACLFVAANLFGSSISRSGHTEQTKAINFKIGLDRLNVPANTIRFPEQRVAGAINKLEMYLHWPSLSGYSESLKTVFDEQIDTANIIFLTLEKRTMSLDMSGRIAPIYSRFFEGIGVQQAFGLVQQPLSNKAGFLDEDLFFAAASPYPYAARCVRESSVIATPFCIRDIHVGRDLMLTYRFHKRFLPQWIELDQAMRQYVKSLVTNL